MTPAALARQNGILRATVSLDIVSDALRRSHLYRSGLHCILKAAVISVPIILLWNVQIPLRRKLVLWGILCLSIFTAMTAVIKVAGSNTNHGQVDSAWAIFWQQAEAAVAIIVVSITAFRALFVAHRASKQQSPAQYSSKTRSIWRKSDRHHDDIPVIRVPSGTGVRTYIRQSPYSADSFEESRDIELPLHGPGILVTQHMSSEKVGCAMIRNHPTLTLTLTSLQTNPHEVPKKSAESFV